MELDHEKELLDYEVEEHVDRVGLVDRVGRVDLVDRVGLGLVDRVGLEDH